MKNLLKNTAKLALAGGIIAAIGFQVLTTEPTNPTQVAEVRADVASFNLGDDGNEFTRAMAELGLKPRPYDLNGNVMYFAAGTTDKLPLEIEDIVSDTLIDHGVNSAPTTEDAAFGQSAAGWMFPGSLDEAKIEQMVENVKPFKSQTEKMMRNEVVTTVRDKALVRMEGVKWNLTADEIVERMKDDTIPTREKSSKDLIGGYRFIEAAYDPGDGMTDISAVWSGNDFDPRKMDNTAFVKQEPDPSVPACMGCERQFRMQSLGQDEPHRSNEWHTNTSLDQTYRFYQTAMGNRGWRESDVQRMLTDAAKIVPELAAIEGRMLHLEQDGKSMQIAMFPDGRGGTYVVSHEQYEGAESIIPR